MSSLVLGWVFEHSPEKGGRRHVLISLADAADHDGSNAYEAVKTIAHKSRLSVRATQECLRALEKAEAITKTGVSQYGTNVYSVNMNGGADSAGVQNHVPEVSKTAPNQVLSLLESDSSSTSTERESSKSGADFGRGASQTAPPWPATVNRKPVSEKEGRFALNVLARFNAIFDTSFTAHGHLTRIIMRCREHSELGLEEHSQIMERNKAAPWWTGDASTAVIYGKDDLFEQCMRCNGVRVPRTKAERTSNQIQRLLSGTLIPEASARVRGES